MKKTVFVLLAICALLTSCNKDNDKPTKKEKNMVKEEMTWKLDSVKVIYNYQTSQEESFVVHEGEGLSFGSYTFYPWEYQFPSDLTVQNVMTGKITSLAEKYSDNYCKYIAQNRDGEFLSGGYLCYYTDKDRNDHFSLMGIKADGMAEMRVVEAEAQWDTQVWTITYNPSEDVDGTVLERRVEYYSRVR